MHDDLLAQARSLGAGIEQLDNEIATREADLERIKDDRNGMAKRLGSVERFLDAEAVPLPYSDRKGI